MKTEFGKICRSCWLEKQTKKSHKLLQHAFMTRGLELLHMDLMRPMQIESIAGIRYIFVCVDDYFIFLWTNFLRKKSFAFIVFEDLWLKLAK